MSKLSSLALFSKDNADKENNTSYIDGYSNGFKESLTMSYLQLLEYKHQLDVYAIMGERSQAVLECCRMLQTLLNDMENENE